MDIALCVSDPKAFVDCLERMASDRCMSRVAREVGLAREALYSVLRADGNPVFATVLKVVGAFGIQLFASANSAT